MTICLRQQKLRGFTLVELLVVLAIIGILASLLLPALAKSKPRAQRIACLGNLHQVGVAFHLFAHDHDGAFPMGVKTNSGGVNELVPPGVAFAEMPEVFSAMTFELSTPKILVCPSDTRRPVENFARLAPEHVSYFVGLLAKPSEPLSVLAGDRNVIAAGNSLKWNQSLHEFKGNLLLADTHVEQRNSWESATALASLSRPTTPSGPRPNAFSPPANSSNPLQQPKPTAAPKSPELPGKNGAVNFTPPHNDGSIPDLGNSADGESGPGKKSPVGKVAISPATDEDGDFGPGFNAFQRLFVLGYSISALWALIVLLLWVWKKIRERRALLEESRRWHAMRSLAQ